MLIENSSDLIQTLRQSKLASGRVADLAILINGQVLAVSEDALALFARVEDVADELGNGLLNSVAIPQAWHLSLERGCYIQEHKAGYVGLSGGRVLLITLNDVQMFPSKQEALCNHNELVRLPLGG